MRKSPIIISVLTNMKWKVREVWSLDQGHPAGEWRAGNSNPSPADFLTHIVAPTLRASKGVEQENMSASLTSRSHFSLFLLCLWLLSQEKSI